MNNFGVIEVASARTTHAPGWAYVPDTPASSIPSQSVSAVHLHVNRNKRAARQSKNASSAAAASSVVNERHDARLQKEIEQLQRDTFGGRGGEHFSQLVPIPSGGRDKDGKIRGHTANVRKILASQKTFANHLDDFDAWRRTQVTTGTGDGATTGGAGQSATGTPAPPSIPSSGVGNKKGSTGGGSNSAAAQKKGGGISSSSSRARSAGSNQKKSATPAPVPDTDVTMTDAPALPAAAEVTEEETHQQQQQQQQPEGSSTTTDTTTAESNGSKILAPFTRFMPPSHPGDADPLLESWLPPLPSDEELRELMGAPPLNYHQARGVWTDEDQRYPARHFCEVCGYWGRVRCMKCGTRVCALDCLNVHREECVTRYGL